MKRFFIFTLTCCLAGAGSMLEAQTPVKAATTIVKTAAKTPAVVQPPKGVTLPAKILSSEVSRLRYIPQNRTLTVREPMEDPWAKIRALQEENAKLRQVNMDLQKTLGEKAIPSDAYIFQAREVSDINIPTNVFSGAVFSAVYNGQKEVYGVIATHAIASETTEKHALHKTFSAVIYKNGIQKIVPVEVVAASPKSMLDIALVKFPQETEGLLVPYRLGDLTSETSLISKGFSGKMPSSIARREIVACTPTSIRTTMPLQRSARPGLCGSAVLNEKNELVGIHTGSIYSEKGEEFDIAYATPSHYLKNLVEAYHNNGQTEIPFTLNDHKVADFSLDEYITYITLSDANKKIVWQLQVGSKFSYSKLQKALAENPQAQFLQITTRRAAWTDDGYAFVENRGKTDRSTKTTYTYDLQANELLSKVQSVYNPANRKRKTVVAYSKE